MEKYKIVFCGKTEEDAPLGEAIVDDAFVKMSEETDCRNKALKGRFTSCFIYEMKDELPEGDVAELGVYKGGITKFMASCFPNKTVYAFDTFEGMPDIVGDKDDPCVEGMFQEVDDVLEYLNDPNIEIRKGIFPSTTEGLDDKTFSLVHLDADIYESTLAGLQFFWPRMAVGGVIIMDDFEFANTPGVKVAFDEYFDENPPKIKVLLIDPEMDQPHIISIKNTL